MPYIRKDARERYDAHIDALRLRLKLRPIGDLTYVIYRLVNGWIAPDKSKQPCRCRQCGALTATPQQGLCITCYENGVMLGQLDENLSQRYAAFAQALGSLRSVSFEIERRHLAPYEDGKIEENGDA